MLTFTENVRVELARKRHNQAWLAKELGVAQTTVSRWLRDENRITLVDALRVADVLEVPLAELVASR